MDSEAAGRIIGRATSDLRKLLDEPTGNEFTQRGLDSALKATEALGWAVADLFSGAVIRGGTPGGVTVERGHPFANDVADKARALARAARG